MFLKIKVSYLQWHLETFCRISSWSFYIRIKWQNVRISWIFNKIIKKKKKKNREHFSLEDHSGSGCGKNLFSDFRDFCNFWQGKYPCFSMSRITLEHFWKWRTHGCQSKSFAFLNETKWIVIRSFFYISLNYSLSLIQLSSPLDTLHLILHSTCNVFHAQNWIKNYHSAASTI